MRNVLIYILVIGLYSKTSSQSINFFNINLAEYDQEIGFEEKINNIIGLDKAILISEKPHQSLNDRIGFTHEKYSLSYQSIPIEFSTVILHKTNNLIKSISGEYFDNLECLDILTNISSDVALDKALKYINAKQYIWDTKDGVKPKGELVYIANYLNKEDNKIHLAYKFEINSTIPFRIENIYVSSKNGEVLLTNSLIFNATGTADTRYSGQRTISTLFIANNFFHLRDNSRGDGIATYETGVGIFTNAGSLWTGPNWDNAEKDNAALDAHWGMMKTYDYFKDIHSWNSFDGDNGFIVSKIHYILPGQPDGNNSYFIPNDGIFYFGDGNDVNDPWTSLDIVAHEFGHGVEFHTANLLYSGEPAGINESFSDIWGACVENYADPNKDVWNIGENFHAPPALRSMSDPNCLSSPDTYGGNYWFLNPSNNTVNPPHIICGVSNYWFYLLSEGGNDVNDNSDQYDVYGISILKAEKIAFRALTNYFTPNTNYNQARNLTIQAAIDLYGECSQEVVSTTNAWHAVGVGNHFQKEFSILVSNNIQYNTNEVFVAEDNVIASSTIGNGSNITFLAGRFVTLKPGFHTKNNFLARIELCENLDFGNFSSKRSQEVNSKSKLEKPNKCFFNLYNIEGEKIMNKTILDNKTNVSLEYLSSGVYFVEVVSENNIEYIKVIKK